MFLIDYLISVEPHVCIIHNCYCSQSARIFIFLFFQHWYKTLLPLTAHSPWFVKINVVFFVSFFFCRLWTPHKFLFHRQLNVVNTHFKWSFDLLMHLIFCIVFLFTHNFSPECKWFKSYNRKMTLKITKYIHSKHNLQRRINAAI